MVEQTAIEQEKARQIVLGFYKEMERNPLLFGNYFFPRRMWRKPAWFQAEIMNFAFKHELYGDGRSYLSIAAPRGSAKSELIVFVYLFFCLVFKKKRHVVIVSNTFAKAAKHLDNIKMELKDNPEIKRAFPGLRIRRDAEGDSVLRHKDGFETRILCKGVDQIGSIRGEKFGQYRPDLVIGDDMEDDELVKNQERRAKLREDFDTALVPAGDSGTQYIFIGTVLHDDCQIARLVSPEYYPEFTKLFYKALMEENNEKVSLWPEKWSVADLEKMMREKPLTFAKEMQNDPVAGSNTRFKREDFRRWDIKDGSYILYDENGKPYSQGRLGDCRAAIACDLAWKEKREADRSVIMPGLLTPNSELLIDSYVNETGMRPDRLAELLFLMEARLRKLTGAVVPVGFEKAMLENVTQWLLRQEMKKRNTWLVTKELLWDTDKNTRIETRLQPRYCQHAIFHRANMGDLEYQLERFPYGSKDDLVDAAQGLVQLLQYAKTIKKVTQDDAFEFFRDLSINSKKRKPENYSFGQKGKRYKGIPAMKTWR